jgi:sialic acid synthase SpsE
MKLRIGNRLVGDDEPCFIIGEVGINHNGSLELAMRLIEVAKEAGCDAVKFQKRTINRILTKDLLNMPYVGPTSLGSTYGEHRRRLELTRNDYKKIVERCRELEIIFLASAWDEEAVDFLEEFDVPAHKIASADLTNLPLLRYVASKGKPVILSTGMSDISEIDEAVSTIRNHCDQLILLQCTSTYPSRFEEVNLRTMSLLRERFHCPVGYSGHELGIAVSAAARALGACVIERHFTLDRTMQGPDHAASLEPTGLKKLVRDIRAIEMALGEKEKKVLERERPIRMRLAKSIVASKKIKKGTILTQDLITQKSPGSGLSPIWIDRIIGKRLRRDLEEDEIIKKEDLDW